MGIARDEEGRITGWSLYTGDPDLETLTDAERLLYPSLNWIADGRNPSEARRSHPVIGPLDDLVELWCEHRNLYALSQVLPIVIQGVNGRPAWDRLLEALERLDDLAGHEDEETVNLLQAVLRETRRVVAAADAQ